MFWTGRLSILFRLNNDYTTIMSYKDNVYYLYIKDIYLYKTKTALKLIKTVEMN